MRVIVLVIFADETTEQNATVVATVPTYFLAKEPRSDLCSGENRNDLKRVGTMNEELALKFISWTIWTFFVDFLLILVLGKWS